VLREGGLDKWAGIVVQPASRVAVVNHAFRRRTIAAEVLNAARGGRHARYSRRERNVFRENVLAGAKRVWRVGERTVSREGQRSVDRRCQQPRGQLVALEVDVVG